MTDLLVLTDWSTVFGLLALVVGAGAFLSLLRAPVGTPSMEEVADQIRAGARAFLGRELLVLGVTTGLVGVLLLWMFGAGIASSFATGAVGSALAGWAALEASTRANLRTAAAAHAEGDARALRVAFLGGSVGGFAVAGLGLVGLGAFYWLFASAAVPGTDELPRFASRVSAFALGAVLVALLARVAGGIYTKSADVAADLVGQLEASLPEDDPRNPASLADAVGDNVGDVAGRTADAFGSYVAALAATMAIGGTSAAMMGNATAAAALPLLTALVGLLASLAGAALIRVLGRTASAAALRNTSLVSSALFLAVMYLVVARMDMEIIDAMTGRILPWWGTWAAVATGALAGNVVALATEYHTAAGPVRKIADAAQGAAATNLIAGVALGLQSTIVPMIVICGSILLSYLFAGLYGIGIAAVALLATVGVTAAVDAYAPIADNARGIGELSQLSRETRAVTDSLDAIGDKTSAIGRGYAVTSTALTALALFGAYGSLVGLAQSGINLIDPFVVIGVLLGGLLPFLVAALSLAGAGRGANAMIAEVRRQLRETPGILEGRTRPDTARCLEISNRAAVREMPIPCAAAVLAPVLVGYLLGVTALGGMLLGATVTGVLLSLFLGNAGAAWDHAKRYIEGGAHGGKGSPAHRAAGVGDALGDPLKALAPALETLVKLVCLIALVLAPWLVRLSESADGGALSHAGRAARALFG